MSDFKQPSPGGGRENTLGNQDVPLYATVPKACQRLGVGRTNLYAKIGEGHIRAVKCGARTLICMESALAYMAALPQAQIAPQVRRPVAA